MIRGLDVSSCQSLVDFDKLPSWVRFLVVKVSEGETGMDPMRARNLAEARRRGMPVFVYHFFRTGQDAPKQAENIWRAVGEQAPLLVFVDFETIAKGMSATEAVTKCVALVRLVKAMFFRCGVYMFPWFAKGAIGAAVLAAVGAELGDTYLWMADYSGGEDPPARWNAFTPLPWMTWTMAQTSGDNSSHVPGIAGAVDHNVFHGDEDAFKAFCGTPRPDQLEPDAPIIHTHDYSHDDDPPFGPDGSS